MKKFTRCVVAITVSFVLSLQLIPVYPAWNIEVGSPPRAYAEEALPLILEEDSVDYEAFIPEIICSDTVESALDIKNPGISLEAASAILLDSEGKVLYHKNATAAVFPGSTAKILSALVVLDWCKADEVVTVGNELKMITEDASVAGLKKGEKLTVASLLAAMLLPSGNDAAYVAAAFVGKKSLKKPKAGSYTAVREFTRLMNEKAAKLGAENSCFVTPDGYDALGQYTTAYDMGRIALAALKSKTIMKIAAKYSMTVTMVSGEKLTLRNTNALINKNSEWYNSCAIGLKTGTTSMAGKCLLSAAKSDKGIVISVVMNSTTRGRWNDSNKLLQYGLKNIK